MRSGDLVTVLPYGKHHYLLIEEVAGSIPDDDLGDLWMLYGPCRPGGNYCETMFSKWIQILNTTEE